MKNKSVIPIYLTALTWLIYSVIFPLYTLWHFFIALAVSAAIYFASSVLFKKSGGDIK